MPRVLVVDDHPVVAEGLRVFLTHEGYQVECCHAQAGAATVMSAAASFAPQVVLLDRHLGCPVGDASGLVGPLRQIGAQVVVLAGRADPVREAACLAAGAAAVVDKHEPVEDILAHVSELAGRPPTLPRPAPDGPAPPVAAAPAPEGPGGHRRQQLVRFATLSPREEEILAALAQGRSPGQIAATSYRSITTVRSHIRAILRKLRVESHLQAVVLAYQVAWPGTFENPPK